MKQSPPGLSRSVKAVLPKPDMTKVVQFSTVHPAFDIRVFHRECRSLAEAGHEVVLVAPHDQDETAYGVRIRAVPRPRSRVDRALRSIWRVFKAAVSEHGRVYHFHDPELIPVGIVLRLMGKRVIYDAHEDSPRDIMDKGYIPRVLRYPISLLTELFELTGMACFSALVAATPAIARRFPKKKTIVVQNFPIQEECEPEECLPFQRRPNNVIYVGAISEIRGLREMVQALSLLPADLRAKLVLAGRWEPPALQTEAAQWPGWNNVSFIGWRPRKDILREYNRARLGLVLFHPNPTHPESQPAKLFEYMSAGLPVVASDFAHWRQFITDENCGLLVDPTDSKAIAQAITWILQHPSEAEEMGRRGQAAVRERFNWSVEAKKLLSLYDQLIR